MQVALNGMLAGETKQSKKISGSQVISQPNNNKTLITASGGVSTLHSLNWTNIDICLAYERRKL